MNRHLKLGKEVPLICFFKAFGFLQISNMKRNVVPVLERPEDGAPLPSGRIVGYCGGIASVCRSCAVTVVSMSSALEGIK